MQLKSLRKRVAVTLVAFMLGLSNEGFSVSLFKEVDALLKRRVEAIGIALHVPIRGEELVVADGLPDFYKSRNYAPAWTDDFGLLPRALPLIRAIQQSDLEGLQPDDYWYPQIVTMLKIVRLNRTKQDLLQPPLLVDLDLLLTNAFLTYGSHLLHGKLNPQSIHPSWIVNVPKPTLAEKLQHAMEQNQVQSHLLALKPDRPGYIALRKTLAKYRRIALKGGWPLVPEGSPLREGVRSNRIPKLRDRLAVTGDIQGKAGKKSTNDIFDVELKQGVIRFQTRHGLPADGVVGPATLSKLRIPLANQITSIEINLERMRWLSQDLEPEHLLVNIPAHTLSIMNNKQIVSTMGVVVGKPERPTPILNDHITDLVFNPHWYVPPTILKNDILPKVKENPEYLKNLRIRVLQYQDGETWEIDTKSIDWDKLDRVRPPFQFRQDAGPENFLGRFKFILTNEQDIYLHDTAFHAQFSGNMLNLSSGCIRLEDPMHLADYLLKTDKYWDAEKITAAVASGTPRKVSLSTPFPVYVVYWTAWVDVNGIIQFGSDIYDLDGAIREALHPGSRIKLHKRLNKKLRE